MPTGKPISAVMDRAEADLAAPIWAMVRDCLEAAKRPINQAIRETPPPIPACDARFNHLLEERAGIVRELNRLESVSARDFAPRGAIEAIEGFINASVYIDAESARTIRTRLKEAVLALETG